MALKDSCAEPDVDSYSFKSSGITMGTGEGYRAHINSLYQFIFCLSAALIIYFFDFNFGTWTGLIDAFGVFITLWAFMHLFFFLIIPYGVTINTAGVFVSYPFRNRFHSWKKIRNFELRELGEGENKLSQIKLWRTNGKSFVLGGKCIKRDVKKALAALEFYRNENLMKSSNFKFGIVNGESKD